jgi:hypothetical protein
MTDQPQGTDTPELVVRLPLSVDELTFLLRESGLNVLPGFQPPDDLNDDNMATARRCLLARGFLRVGDDGALEVNGLVRTMIGAGRTATRVLSIMHALDDGAEAHWFYMTPGDYGVYHHKPLPDVETFETIQSAERLSEFWIGALRISEADADSYPRPRGNEVLIPQAIYDQARTLTREGRGDAAKTRLTDNGVPAGLAASLIESDNRNTVSVTHIVDGEDHMAHRVVLETVDSNGYWVLAPGGAGMHGIPMNAMDVLTMLGELIV